MPLTQDQRDSFDRDGFILVPDAIGTNSTLAALEAIEQIAYGMPFKDYLNEYEQHGKGAVTDGFQGESRGGRTQFPTGIDVLDRMIEEDDYLDMFAQCLGSQDMSYNNAHLFIRFGPTDKRHAENSWEGYHIDHNTNSFLPPSADIYQFGYVNSAVYLHDVEPDGAPMHVIPGSHRKLPELLPELIRTGNWSGNSAVGDLRKVEGFEKPIPTTAKAGSVLFYNSYLVHAAVPFINNRAHRCFWTLSMARNDNQSWTKLANPWQYGERDYLVPFLEKTTPRVRALLGWPPPGHSYYTDQTLELLATWFPGMDLTPYRQFANGESHATD
ncbi:MAG: phytanoyl-CoA dioxygenase family protein [Gemmatimonadota bacterium]|nr:phytanoyl-CoA dioxygenase family protein [Gemmatimonadota bacterium]